MFMRLGVCVSFCPTGTMLSLPGHHVFEAIGNCDVMLDVASQHHLRIGCDQINAFCYSPARRRLSRVRYVPRPSTRRETTGRWMLRRVEQTCACQTTRFP